MDYSSYYQAAQSAAVVPQQPQGLNQFSDYDQQLIQNAANSIAAAEYVKSATRSLYAQPVGSMLTPAPPPPPSQTNSNLYTSHTNLAGPNPTTLASSQYLKLAQPLNSGASTAPPLSLMQHPQQQMNYITYNLGDLKMAAAAAAAANGHTTSSGGSGSGVGVPVHNNNNSSTGSAALYSSLGSLAHSGTRSISNNQSLFCSVSVEFFF